ncbi:MAG: hypothetical protein NTZ69_19280 [Bacteroidia bacterium]|nr:hypothetical protein [Bacteroidia bacterium]
MKTLYSLIICLFLIPYSCKKSDDLGTNPPKTPEMVMYDFNDDLVNDFSVKYTQVTWDGLNDCGDGIHGEITQLNQNPILKKLNDYSLFLQLNDTIKSDVSLPEYWEKYSGAGLVFISNSSKNNHLWQNEWGISSKNLQDTYYLGISINKNGSQLIGWLKLKIDKSSGRIQIADKKFTSGNFIVIDR